MSDARRLLDAYSRAVSVDAGPLASAIEALMDCGQACTADADANLGETNVAEMVRCIRLCLHCADLCFLTARVASRLGEYEAAVLKPLLEACIAVCHDCGDECARHAGMHEHCRVCGDACRRCEQACRDLLAALS